MGHMTVVPAYGRDYTTAREAVIDWKDHKDFAEPMIGGRPIGGTYVSIDESEIVKEMGASHVRIRFNKKLNFVDVKL